MLFLSELFKKCITFLSVWGGGGHMQHISNGFYHVTFRSPSKVEILMGGGRLCNFTLTILKKNRLLLELRINFSHTIHARNKKHA